MSPEWAVVIDYKTGRRDGNQLKHAEQTQLYTVGTFMKYPKLERVTAELWYPDENDLARVEYTREQGMKFFKRWNQRGIEITSTTDFPANPNKFSCQFCHLGPRNDGPCKVGV
jgi:CRISPR/Cas system-associated exonuclease Cas4 (RecB family)